MGPLFISAYYAWSRFLRSLLKKFYACFMFYINTGISYDCREMYGNCTGFFCCLVSRHSVNLT